MSRLFSLPNEKRGRAVGLDLFTASKPMHATLPSPRFRGSDKTHPRHYHRQAFSLVEVVLALGIFSFAIIAVLGLFSVGLQNSKESEDEIRAANLTSSLFCRMRSAPDVDLTSYGFPFAALTNAGGALFNATTSAPLYLKSDGTTASSASAAQAAHGYAVSAVGSYDATNRVATVSLTLWWPPAAAYSHATGQYGVTTYINTEAP
jgi:Tfp pilus assembly protein PilV